MNDISASQVGKMLGVSADGLKILEKQGLLNATRTDGKTRFYAANEIAKIKRNRGLSIADEAEVVNTQIQRNIVSSVSLTRRALILAGITLSGYILLFLVFTGLFIITPVQTAQWIGIVSKTGNNVPLQPTDAGGRVLGATSTVPGKQTSLLQSVFQPIGKASLGFVRNISPNSYAKVAQVAILDTSDVLGLDTNGAIIPERPINLPESSFLQVGTNELVTNLNSQYIQGRQPGTNVGDLAIVGEAEPTPIPGTTNPTISGLTNTNLSGKAGIVNANLANSSVTIDTSGPLSGGGPISLGGTLTLSCPTCLLTGSSLFTADSTNLVTNKTIDAQSNTISNLSATNLTAGDYSSKITSGTYAINITGSVTSAINFTGTLVGDVTGTQGSTSVSKINGVSLGTTTATSGNLLIGSGTQWTTQALSGDATINSSGVLSLKNTGTAGTYGTATSIPVLTTDTQGRITGVTSTTIAGLSATNLIAGDYSSKITSGTYTINISGNAATATSATSATTATNFSGSLLGDVSGTQGATSVDKIKGVTLGTTTATSGNLLIGSGTQWVTHALSGDATIDSTGVLTLKNTGTAGIYGSALNIPVVTTDAQGRVTGVTNTAISGLTNSNLSGTAGITNANLANSSLTLSGNSGSGSVSLGSTLSISGSGISSVNASGATLSITSTEADTLASVTGRGASTSTTVILNGGVTTTTTSTLTLDSGTTGNVNLGTGANAKTVAIGNTTGGTMLNLNSGTGNINFTVDSTASSGKVQIGNSGTATPDLLVLDSGTADPTGVNGGMFYNSSTGKFRCFENSAWANCITPPGTDIQHAASYDTDEAFTNVPTGGGQTTLGTVSVTPTAATGDIYVTGFAEVRSSNNTDQPFNLVIETTSNCTGTTVGNASVTYTISTNTSTTTHLGNIRVSGIAVDAGASAHPYSLCAAISSGAGDSDVMNWAIEATVIDTGADLAEIYTTNDKSVEAGDVVSLDADLQTGVKKSQKAYEAALIGVIATNPGLVIGGVGKEGVKALPVALSGRVPVKVTTENGSIAPGDYLTSSSTFGVAMKATRNDAVIGMSLSSYDNEGIGTVLVFVKNSAHAIAGVSDVSPDTTSILGKVTDAFKKVFTNIVEFFGNVIFHADVTFLGHTAFSKDTAGHAFIKVGESEVKVVFEKEYEKSPIVTASVNLVGGVKPDEIPEYAVYDVSANGFTIKLSRNAPFDLNFAWIAIGVKEEGIHESKVTLTATPSPTQKIVPESTGVNVE